MSLKMDLYDISDKIKIRMNEDRNIEIIEDLMNDMIMVQVKFRLKLMDETNIIKYGLPHFIEHIVANDLTEYIRENNMHHASGTSVFNLNLGVVKSSIKSKFIKEGESEDLNIGEVLDRIWKSLDKYSHEEATDRIEIEKGIILSEETDDKNVNDMYNRYVDYLCTRREDRYGLNINILGNREHIKSFTTKDIMDGLRYILATSDVRLKVTFPHEIDNESEINKYDDILNACEFFMKRLTYLRKEFKESYSNLPEHIRLDLTNEENNMQGKYEIVKDRGLSKYYIETEADDVRPILNGNMEDYEGYYAASTKDRADFLFKYYITNRLLFMGNNSIAFEKLREQGKSYAIRSHFLSFQYNVLVKYVSGLLHNWWIYYHEVECENEEQIDKLFEIFERKEHHEFIRNNIDKVKLPVLINIITNIDDFIDVLPKFDIGSLRDSIMDIKPYEIIEFVDNIFNREYCKVFIPKRVKPQL